MCVGWEVRFRMGSFSEKETDRQHFLTIVLTFYIGKCAAEMKMHVRCTVGAHYAELHIDQIQLTTASRSMHLTMCFQSHSAQKAVKLTLNIIEHVLCGKGVPRSPPPPQ
jgi:hypothetical protein